MVFKCILETANKMTDILEVRLHPYQVINLFLRFSWGYLKKSKVSLNTKYISFPLIYGCLGVKYIFVFK